MSQPKKTFEHTDAKATHATKRTKLLIVLSAAFLVVVVCVVSIVPQIFNNRSNNEKTPFPEQQTKLVGKDEYITINDATLGEVELKAVEGFVKNSYINENFITDKSGKKTYYIDSQVASTIGVDLSEHQGVVDFEKLKEQGFSFVMLRIGGRYYTEKGEMFVDTNFHHYYKAAKDAGLKVGGYFFSQAKNEQEAIDEANFALSSIIGMPLDYPVAFDWELVKDEPARTDSVSSEDLTDAAIAFCTTIEEAGFKPIIYTNTNLMYFKYDLERLKDYEFWLTDFEEYPSSYYHFTMWQYTEQGKVEGIDGNVDMNVCMKNY